MKHIPILAKFVQSWEAVESQVRKAYALFEGSLVLKRFLLIFNDLILCSRVDRGMPSLAAAPEVPYTRPPLSLSAASMIAFS